MRISDWSSDVCSSDLTLSGRRNAVERPCFGFPALCHHLSGPAWPHRGPDHAPVASRRRRSSALAAGAQLCRPRLLDRDRDGAGDARRRLLAPARGTDPARYELFEITVRFGETEKG